jgi:hypothetical protein
MTNDNHSKPMQAGLAAAGMAETKWTPGPWEIASYSASTVKAGKQVIAIVYGDHPKCEPDERQAANTKLIAAAPDLYEALIKLTAKYLRLAAAYCEIQPSAAPSFETLKAEILSRQSTGRTIMIARYRELTAGMTLWQIAGEWIAAASIFAGLIVGLWFGAAMGWK